MCEPGACPSVVAAKDPSGGAAIAYPLTGEWVPLYVNQFPLLPVWFQTLQPEKSPLSNPPLRTGVAEAVATDPRRHRAATKAARQKRLPLTFRMSPFTG